MAKGRSMSDVLVNGDPPTVWQKNQIKFLVFLVAASGGGSFWQGASQQRDLKNQIESLQTTVIDHNKQMGHLGGLELIRGLDSMHQRDVVRLESITAGWLQRDEFDSWKEQHAIIHAMIEDGS